VRRAADLGVPILGVVSTSGAEVNEGLAALHAWGRVARALASASGVVPTVLVVTGPCLSGPALLLGLADVVIMTPQALAYVSGPPAVAAFTGIHVPPDLLGGSAVHTRRSGVAWLVADDEESGIECGAAVLSYLPANNLEEPPTHWEEDPPDRECVTAAATVPDAPHASYDVRVVIEDVCDRGSWLELRPLYAPNLVTGLAGLAGRPVGVVANQPNHRAGTIDIEASRKAARFVQWCDAFNVPIVTFVDTPGFEPGRDLEWRGMIRHGAQLVVAYGEASVPRLCVLLRKAYGGAYIVMDSKTLGNDLCLAWPRAEIAVMGAPAAVQVLHGRRLAALAEAQAERATLEADYARRFCTPAQAAERGYVDLIVEPPATRRVLIDGLRLLATKHERHPRRRHSNTPL